mmetsp:Transcript_39994/g.89640  ORF Transcript_39994/g.89640 Transcript_39994/m.89640 type:complete len:85 (-) Transcript_39994:153-407(-)
MPFLLSHKVEQPSTTPQMTSTCPLASPEESDQPLLSSLPAGTVIQLIERLTGRVVRAIITLFKCPAWVCYPQLQAHAALVQVEL